MGSYDLDFNKLNGLKFSHSQKEFWGEISGGCQSSLAKEVVAP